MLTKLKEKVQKLLASQVKAAHKIGITPNMLSIIGIASAFLSALAYAYAYLLHATMLLLFSGYCDSLDGALARQFQKATAFGGFLDSLLDRYADATVYAGIILGRLCDISWGLTALVGSFLVSYVRARSEAAGIKMESVGLAERAERIIILAIASVTAIFWPSALEAGIILLAIITNLTVLQRVLHVYKELKRKT